MTWPQTSWSSHVQLESNASQEPAKRELLKYDNGGAVLPRRAFAIIQCWPQMPLVEITVELEGQPRVSSWTQVSQFPNLQGA